MSRLTLLSSILFILGCSDDDVVKKDSSATDSGKSDMTKKVDMAKGDTAAVKDSAATASLSKSVQPIFTASCAGGSCHGGSAPKAGLNLTSGKAYSNLVGVASKQCSSLKLVEAGAAAKSYLVQKIEGSGSCFAMKKMPVGGTLSAAQVASVKAWIAAGAKND